MPYVIKKNDADCPKSKPYGVRTQGGDSKLHGCHPSRAKAEEQQRALYENVPDARSGSQSDMTMTEPHADLGGKPNQGTAKDKRLRENQTPCPEGQRRDAGGHCVEMSADELALAADLEEFGWDGSPSRFDDAEYKRSCAVCDSGRGATPKEQCALPHHDPGGALNRQGLAAAAGRFNQSKLSPADKEKARRHLAAHYRELGEDVPGNLQASAVDWEALRAHLAQQEIGVPPEQQGGGAHWSGVMVVEGVTTGDRREFAPNALSWEDPAKVPMALQWQKETGHGSDHDVTVSVGRIEKVWREGNKILGSGRFDTSADAIEAQRRMGEQMLNGCSINADNIDNAQIEYIWPESDPEVEEEGDILALLFGTPDKVVFHGGRIRGVTLCDIPAFVEAVLHIVDPATAAETPALAAVAPNPRAVAAHDAELSDRVWDPAEQEQQLPASFPRELAAAAYAHIDGDERVSVANCRFLHHELVDGTPGPANISACQAAIQALYGSRIPDEDKEAVYQHLAAHLKAAGREPPPFEPEAALVAHAWNEQMWRPPRAWFDDPGINVPTTVIVTDEGRVYGLAAEWTECHIGFGDRCVPPPRADYHDRFMTGELTCDNGQTIAVGQITAGIGHAPLPWSANRAAEHYDNTEAAVADVVVGNNRVGIWVAGAVRPWAQASRVHELRASGEISPDWRRIGGKWKLVGLLTVNTSGFQGRKPRMRTYSESGDVRTMVASGMVSVHRGADPAEVEQRAMAMVKEQLRRMVHPEDH